MELKDWIRAARGQKKWTQTKLGDELGVTKGNVSAWEVGRHEPSFAQLQKIAEMTGYPLLGNDLSNKPQQTRPAISTVAHLQRHLVLLGATRRKTVGDLLARLAIEPENDDLAADLGMLLEPQSQQSMAA